MQRAESSKIDLAKQLVDVVQAMFTRAIAGDVAAAKLILDRLTDGDPVRLEVDGMTTEQRVAAIKSILQAAARREDVGA